MADPFTAAFALFVAVVKHKAITGFVDHVTLGRFKKAYNSLEDKRRRPGPRMRKLIEQIDDGTPFDEVREEIKDMLTDMANCGDSDLMELAAELLDKIGHLLG